MPRLAALPADALTIRRAQNGSWDGSASLAILSLARDIATEGPVDVVLTITEPSGAVTLSGALAGVTSRGNLIVDDRLIDVDDVTVIAFP